MNRSIKTMANNAVASIEARIRRVFNNDFFSFYDGIVESVDLINGALGVRIPSLNNILCEDCKIMLPCATETSAIYPNFQINSTVLVGFKGFSLANPIVLGATINAVNIPIISNTISLVNADCKIIINNSEITITNGTSTISISDAGISLTGPFISANGEDLSDDDVGEI